MMIIVLPDSAPGNEQPYLYVQTEGQENGQQLCGKGSGVFGLQQVEHEPALCPGSQ